MGRDMLEVHVASAEDGLGVVLMITNRSPSPVTVFEPHPHESVQLLDANGRRWPAHYGVFPANPRWQVIVPAGDTRQRIVTLPPFFLDARGLFNVECAVWIQAGDRDERVTVHGPVRLALPTKDEYYSERGAAARVQVQRYEQAGFVHPLPDQAWPATATEQLKSAIDRVLATVDDPAFKGDEKAMERRAAVRKVADEIFEFTELADRSLTGIWRRLSEPQRTGFVELFGDLLERSYVSRIELYSGEKIIYSFEWLNGDFAFVRTRIIAKNRTEVPVDYHLRRRGDRWMIYDVNIEGASLASKYRTQFNEILRSGGYDSLVESMKNCGIGSWGAPGGAVSENGRSRQGAGGYPRGDRHRRG